MRDFTCDSLLDLYLFLRENVRDLPDERLEFLTPDECDEFRAEVLEELRKDFAFKLLTLLEAGLRDDFLKSLKRRRRDVISTAYRDLCRRFRRETRQVSKPAIQPAGECALSGSSTNCESVSSGLIRHFGGSARLPRGTSGFETGMHTAGLAHNRRRSFPIRKT